MKLTLTTPERQLLDSIDVDKVTIPTISGEITILPMHMPLISSLGRGEMLLYVNNKEPDAYFLSGGVVQVYEDNINILANLAEMAQEIDEASIEESIRRAKEGAQEAETSVNIAEIQGKLANDLARLKLASKYKNKPKRNF